jgi:hypothetical protein
VRTLILATAFVTVFAAASANGGPEVSFDFGRFSVTRDAPAPDGYADAITNMLVPPADWKKLGLPYNDAQKSTAYLIDSGDKGKVITVDRRLSLRPNVRFLLQIARPSAIPLRHRSMFEWEVEDWKILYQSSLSSDSPKLFHRAYLLRRREGGALFGIVFHGGAWASINWPAPSTSAQVASLEAATRSLAEQLRRVYPSQVEPLSRKLDNSSPVPTCPDLPDPEIHASASAPPAPPRIEYPSLGSATSPPPPTPGTYAYAVKQGGPHTCELSVPGFFGESNELLAYVKGENFEAVEPGSGTHFVRLNGIGYTRGNGPDGLPVLMKFRLDDYNEAYMRLMRHSPPRWDNGFVFVEPASHEPCAPAPSRPILLPDGEPKDFTDALVAHLHDNFGKSVSMLGEPPFTLLMPDPAIARLFPATRGHASTSAYSIQYLVHASAPGEESSQLSIGFGAHSEDASASQCGGSRPVRNCAHVFTTRKGYEVFRRLEITGSSSRNPRLPHYYAKVDDVLVHLAYPHWTRSTSGEVEWTAHEFADCELGTIIDSLREVAPEDLVRFPGLTVYSSP